MHLVLNIKNVKNIFLSKLIKMKTSVSIFVLCAFVAFVQSTPVPQDVAPVEAAVVTNPIYGAFSAAANTANVALSGLANTGLNVAKTVAENTGRFIDNTANAMNNAAHTLSSTLTRPFQSDAAAVAAP